MSTAYAQEQQTYTVRPGDTLYRISRMYGLSVEELRGLNGLEGNLIQIGQQLIVRIPENDLHARLQAAPDPIMLAPQADSSLIALPNTPVASSTGRQPAGELPTYVVRPGDTLYGIAARFGTAAYLLYTLNEGIRDPLREGQVLRLPRESQTSARDSADAPPEEQLPEVFAVGPVLVYPETYEGRATASGKPYDPALFTVSHPELPLGTIVLVENPSTRQHTFAEVNDRGPLDKAYLMDVSAAVARHIGLDKMNTPTVRIRIVE